MKQKVQRLEGERDNLEKQVSRAVREAENLRRSLELEKTERQMTEAKTLELIKDIKRNWEKCAEKEKSEFSNEIQVKKIFGHNFSGRLKSKNSKMFADVEGSEYRPEEQVGREL